MFIKMIAREMHYRPLFEVNYTTVAIQESKMGKLIGRFIEYVTDNYDTIDPDTFLGKGLKAPEKTGTQPAAEPTPKAQETEKPAPKAVEAPSVDVFGSSKANKDAEEVKNVVEDAPKIVVQEEEETKKKPGRRRAAQPLGDRI